MWRYYPVGGQADALRNAKSINAMDNDIKRDALGRILPGSGHAFWAKARRCNARLRGKPERRCRRACARGRSRCKLHGGAVGVGAPKGNKNAFKHGRRSAAWIASRRRSTELLRALHRLARAHGMIEP